MKHPTLSVVLPVYNEADVIEKVVQDFYNKVIKKFPKSELIVAEDGSTDGTKDVLIKLQKSIPMRLVMGKERKGYFKGVKDALLLAKGDIVFYSDTDNTHDPKDLFKLLEKIEEYDLVMGVKLHRNDPLNRILFSRIYNLLIYLMFGIYIKDINAGFKLMKREIVEEYMPKIKYLKYGFSTELVIRVKNDGKRIVGVPISHFKRETIKADQFKITSNVILMQLKGLLKLWLELRRQRKSFYFY